MIPLIGLNIFLRTGMMARVKLNEPIVPEISPDIQGLGAYSLLTAEQKGLLKYALKDYAKRRGCNINELRWAFGAKRGGVAPLKIWPPKKPITPLPGILGKLSKSIWGNEKG